MKCYNKPWYVSEYEHKCPDIIDENGYVKKDRYPKSTSILEAVNWMEQGHYTICPYGNTTYLKGGKFYDKNNDGRCIFTLKDFREEWKLLAPEQEEIQYEEDEDQKEVIRLLNKIIDICERKK